MYYTTDMGLISISNIDTSPRPSGVSPSVQTFLPNKSGWHDIAEQLLKVTLNTGNLIQLYACTFRVFYKISLVKSMQGSNLQYKS